MQNCPNCHQPINSQVTTCPYCRKVLTAYGHPGIPLHRATGEQPLCNSCIYHEDDTCNFPQRPYARECTLYSDRSQPQSEAVLQLRWTKSLRLWCQRNRTVLLFSGLAIISFFLALKSMAK